MRYLKLYESFDDSDEETEINDRFWSFVIKYKK